MGRISKNASFVLTMFVLVFLFGTASGSDVRTAETTYGVKAGFIMPGTWYVGDYEYDADMNWSIGGFVDYKLGPKIVGTGKLDIHGFGAYEESGMLFDIGFMMRALVYSETSNLTFRPGFGISYGALGSMGPYDGTSYLMLTGTVEIVFSSQKNFSWMGEFGLVGAVDGGNDDFTATFGPGLIIRGGMLF